MNKVENIHKREAQKSKSRDVFRLFRVPKCFVCSHLWSYKVSEGGDNWQLIILVPKSCSLIRWLKTLCSFSYLDWFIEICRVQTFKPTILIYRNDNIVYHHKECASIYRPLSYPLISLNTRGLPTLYHHRKGQDKYLQ